MRKVYHLSSSQSRSSMEMSEIERIPLHTYPLAYSSNTKCT